MVLPPVVFLGTVVVVWHFRPLRRPPWWRGANPAERAGGFHNPRLFIPALYFGSPGARGSVFLSRNGRVVNSRSDHTIVVWHFMAAPKTPAAERAKAAERAAGFPNPNHFIPAL